MNNKLRRLKMENQEFDTGYEEWLDDESRSDWLNEQTEIEEYERSLEL
jgi:hypothetical protein